MSKQQGQSPEPEIEKSGKSPKKRHGKYELWQRINPEVCYPDDSLRWPSMSMATWHKFRTYETLELAERNKEQQDRKWNMYTPNSQSPEAKRWQFEIRIKE